MSNVNATSIGLEMNINDKPFTRKISSTVVSDVIWSTRVRRNNYDLRESSGIEETRLEG